MTYQEFMEKQWIGFPLDQIKNAILAPNLYLCDSLQYKSIFILTTGLAGEVGESLEHFKKLVRDGKFNSKDAALELGDVLAYLTWLARVAGYSLDEIAEMNKLKLMARGTKEIKT